MCMLVAAGRGVLPAQVALGWLLHKPGVTAPIVGATRLGHLQDALAFPAPGNCGAEQGIRGQGLVPARVRSGAGSRRMLA
jgi:hypothetical protein